MLHPAARILLWFMLVVFLQWAAPLLMLLTAFVLLISGARARQHWRRLFLRARLLLLALFLVFAYGMPGESPAGWLPSREGLAEASLHVLRLVVFLGALSWLFATLSRRDLLGGLWFLLQPCRHLGLPVDKSVARLFLVLEYLENLPRQSWRQWLLLPPETSAETESVRLCLPLWRMRDTGLLCVAALSFVLLLTGFPT